MFLEDKSHHGLEGFQPLFRGEGLEPAGFDFERLVVARVTDAWNHEGMIARRENLG